MPRVYLLSRTLDPLFGVFSGLLAYHLSESHPRSNIPPGHTLRELVPWQFNRWRAARHAGSEGEEEMFERTLRELQEDKVVAK
ncbi:hypothetical protein BD324DRAFT_619127 [Kockovaella imperatae]|uniref:Uncharacterized protein n=1 Tax=Kockovaella imperatae TaxID=4999 RepID=A0A1Y1UMJ9_9TREE|nr:hypothetical protein BD324DRAFT_619127 [Kockovaella imperatae]ORX39283.1 hypothetical protein BD324DRAFT_619127 [Kockovaella imperatae]